MNKTAQEFKSIGVIFLIILGGLFFRRTDAFTHPQLWAEDFPIFFQQFEQFGAKSLITVYGGYLHFIPRLIAILWGELGVSYYNIPACYNWSAFFVTFLVAVNIWKSTGYLNIKNRIPYAVFFMFLPVFPDIFMTITNLNWVTALVLVNFLFARNTDHSSKNYYLTLLLLFVVALSGPFSTILIPVILLIFVVERKVLTFKKVVPLSVILIGGIVQAICIKFIDPNFYRGFPGTTEKYHLFKIIPNNINDLFFLDRFPGIPYKIRLIICLLIFGAILWLFVKGYKRIANPRKYILLLTAVLMFGAFIKAYWPNESLILALENARYYFIPYSCISWLFIVAFDNRLKIGHWVAYTCFFFLHYQNTRFSLPNKHWKQQMDEYYKGKRDTIELNPEGWHFKMYRKK